MSDTLRRQEKHDARARTTLAVKMLTNGGYGLIGIPFGAAMTKRIAPDGIGFFFIALGVAAIVIALIYAPDAYEQPDD